MKRFKVAIETSNSCVGHCVGCAIPEIKKLSQTPVISDESLPYFADKLYDFCSNFLKNSEEDFDCVVIELILGEHFNFSEDYIRKLCVVFKEFSTKINKNFLLAISTSGLILESKIEPKLKIMHEYFDKKNLEVHLVCDLNKFDRYYEKYDKVTKLFDQYCGFINVLINFDSNLNFDECKNFATLFKTYNITNFQLVYGLKEHNASKVGYNTNLYFDVYNEILKSSVKGYRQNDIKEEIENFNSRLDIENFNLNDIIQKSMNKIADEQIFVTSSGDVHYILPTMLGGIELDSRAGFKSLTNIFNESPFLEYTSSKNTSVKDLTKIYLKNNTCQNCAYKEPCYGTGLPFLHKVLMKDNKCFNPIIQFYEHKEDILGKYENTTLSNFSDRTTNNIILNAI